MPVEARYTVGKCAQWKIVGSAGDCGEMEGTYTFQSKTLKKVNKNLNEKPDYQFVVPSLKQRGLQNYN